ncbi:NUDIX domain-containing protein [Kibdelosporangium lantanae]|uniref:NUDIX domain-containing protein n=1 Tax=Kibdelosporangium lantanae TaxID=1497396 RepID=A0ABW3M5T3_9PSEU
MDLLPYDEYAKSLNRKRTAAGVLFYDSAGRVLLVETSYKVSWEIPGGAVEAHETPWATAQREVEEELGFHEPIGRLVAIDHIPEEGVMPEGLAFIFDGGLVAEDAVAVLTSADPEILSVGLYALDDVVDKIKPRLAGRITAALEAIGSGGLALCENGQRVA